MIRSDEQWLGVADAFGTAALDGSWYEALRALAQACGAQTGQLVGFGSDAVTFNYWTDLGPEVLEEFTALDGGNPAVNPRVRAGGAVAELTVLAENDFITADEFRDNPIYRWGRSRGLAYSCLAPLIHSEDGLVGLAVFRSEAQGHIQSAERAVFASLAPHVRAAVRTHMLLEGQALTLLTGALEALSLAAFVCDACGRIVGRTPLAEQHLEAGRLRAQHGRLMASTEAANGRLQDALAAARAARTASAAPLQRTILIHGADSAQAPLVLDVIALPRFAEEFASRPRAVVVVRGPRGYGGDPTAALRAAWGLTEAEAKVALMLAGGRSSSEVAEQRDVSVGTVRMQAKSIYAKIGVNRQAELAARLQPLL